MTEEEKKAKLESLRVDYAKLCNQENTIVQIIMLCDSTLSQINGLSTYNNHINSLVSYSTIPDFNTVINFDDFTQNGLLASSKTDTDSYISELRTKCEEIDNLKRTIADEIAKVK